MASRWAVLMVSLRADMTERSTADWSASKRADERALSSVVRWDFEMAAWTVAR